MERLDTKQDKKWKEALQQPVAAAVVTAVRKIGKEVGRKLKEDPQFATRGARLPSMGNIEHDSEAQNCVSKAAGGRGEDCIGSWR